MSGADTSSTIIVTHTADTPQLLQDHHLKELRLPTILSEYDKVARQCAVEQLDYPRYLLRMTELELLDRERRATERRVRQARFPVINTMDSVDFLAIPTLNSKRAVLLSYRQLGTCIRVDSASRVSLLILVRVCWTVYMESQDEEISSWLEREAAGCQFQDLRHGKKFRTLLGRLSEQIGDSIPFACQDWAATKAAYRFLSNERINEEKILAGYFACTRERTAGTHAGPVLVLHDTTEFIYRREEPHAIGIVHKLQTRYDRPRYHTTSGRLARLVPTH